MIDLLDNNIREFAGNYIRKIWPNISVSLPSDIGVERNAPWAALELHLFGVPAQDIRKAPKELRAALREEFFSDKDCLLIYAHTEDATKIHYQQVIL